MSWIEEVDMSSVSPNEQENLKTYLGNYKSPADAFIGGMNHKKMVGQPFKLPESLDKLSDDQKKEFAAKAKGVLGIEAGVTEDTIKQVNFAKGLSDDQKPNDVAINKIKDIAVKKGFTLSQTQDLIEMMNISGSELAAEMKKTTEDNFKKAVEVSHKILSDFYGEEKLKENAELLRKAFKNNLGLSNEEAESVAEDLMDEGFIFRKPALAKVLIDNFAKLAKEGETDKSKSAKEENKQQQTEKERLSNEGFSEDTLKAIGV